MTEMRAELTGEIITKHPKCSFEVILTDDNKLMILYHMPIDYNGIILDIDGTSALDKMLAEMYRRKMNG